MYMYVYMVVFISINRYAGMYGHIEKQIAELKYSVRMGAMNCGIWAIFVFFIVFFKIYFHNIKKAITL